MTIITKNLEVVSNERATLGEGPHWDAQQARIIWIDILNGAIISFKPSASSSKSTESRHELGELVSFAIPTQNDNLVIGLKDRIALFKNNEGIVKTLADIPNAQTRTRLNDGKCDPLGNLWAGTMDMQESEALGELYRLSTNGKIQLIENLHVTISNGLAWHSNEKTFYYIDSPAQQIYAFDCNLHDGTISNKRCIIQFNEQDGYPDGMTIDHENRLWIAHWGGNKVSCWDPSTRQRLHEIILPVSNVTSCCFGGASLQDLYITTASATLSNKAEEQHAGKLFRVVTNTHGKPSIGFAEQISG